MGDSSGSQSGNTSDYLKMENENRLKEWEKAREVLSSFDDKLHDLRKYGFSFLTALLGAEAVLLGYVKDQEITNQVKFGVFAVTILLICVLHLIDKNYVSFQEAAYTRARVLERILNLELSEIIALRYRIDGIFQHVKWIYRLLIIGVSVFGCLVFFDNWIYFLLMALVALAALAYIFLQNTRSNFYHPYNEDWTIFPLRCTDKEPVTLMITNLKNRTKISRKQLEKLRECPQFEKKVDLVDGLPQSLSFNKGTPIFYIINQETLKVKTIISSENITFYDNYIIVLKKEDFKDIGGNGVYHIYPENRLVPLGRTIIVTD